MSQSSLLAMPRLEQKSMIIDEDHLGRMTLGDRSLEREVLQIFARQTTLMLERISVPSRLVPQRRRIRLKARRAASAPGA